MPLLLLVVVVLVATLCGPLPVRAAPPYAGQEQRFLELINAARTSRGLSKLAASPEVATVARRWSRRMATDDRLRHNPRVGSQIPIKWTRWGENVGYASNGGDQPLRAVTRRCPGRDASRATVATTVARMLALEPSAVSHFTDVAAPSHARRVGRGRRGQGLCARPGSAPVAR